MEHCPSCGQELVPSRAKLVCRSPGCGFMESCCDGGWMHPPSGKACDRNVVSRIQSDAIVDQSDGSRDSELLP